MYVYEIVEATKGTLVSGNINQDITFFSQDSRQMAQGGMYIPLKGERFDGHDFIESAFDTGADAVISHKDVSYPDKIVIRVQDTMQALKDMAIYLREHRPVKVVGVTGSVGKTSTRDMIYSVIKQKYHTLKTEGNYNNEIGLPLTILRYVNEEVMVLEMGMNHLKEMSRLSYIARPDIACITNVGTAHIGELGSRENILKAKLEIVDGMKEGSSLVINDDNDMLHTVSLENMNVIRCGHQDEDQYCLKNVVLNENDSDFDVMIDGQLEHFHLNVQGEHNVSNALIAIAIGRALDIDVAAIQKGLADFVLTKNRMDVINIDHGVTLIDGTYNANVDSMISSLAVLSRYQRRKIAVLADMLELGDYSESLHRQVGKSVVDHHIDVLACVGKEAHYIGEEALKQGMKEVYCFDDNEALLAFLKEELEEKDIVLLKGSHGMHLKEIVDALMKG